MLKARTFAALALLGVCAAGAWRMQSALARGAKRAAAGAAPSPAAEMIVAGLGGFRGLASEFIWLRADRLQEEGRYGELAQLASWLTYLEPKTPEVWAYAAWNLAYNVSVMMPTPADRWRWVQAGMKLLRDDGLGVNPGDPALCRELAWLFSIKMSGHNDSAVAFYRARWVEIVEAARRSGDWAALGMDPAAMARLEARYGALDWTDPSVSALYWARLGLDSPKRPDAATRADLRQAACQALILIAKTDARFAPALIAEMEAALAEAPNPMLAATLEKVRELYAR